MSRGNFFGTVTDRPFHLHPAVVVFFFLFFFPCLFSLPSEREKTKKRRNCSTSLFLDTPHHEISPITITIIRTLMYPSMLTQIVCMYVQHICSYTLYTHTSTRIPKSRKKEEKNEILSESKSKDLTFSSITPPLLLPYPAHIYPNSPADKILTIFFPTPTSFPCVSLPSSIFLPSISSSSIS